MMIVEFRDKNNFQTFNRRLPFQYWKNYDVGCSWSLTFEHGYMLLDKTEMSLNLVAKLKSFFKILGFIWDVSQDSGVDFSNLKDFC